jgi:membrane protease YdiL (CAAX protease family)
VELPKSLEFIEQILKSQEEAAAALTERFLQADNLGGLLINIGLMALLPALSEELSFRGTLQQIIWKDSDHQPNSKVHLAVWITAFIFSAIHMQFYGFVPRMLLGAMFGYVFVWSGSLWVPITMHFVNNGLAVVVYHLTAAEENAKTIADTVGAGDTWYLGVFSILITSLGLLIFYRRTHKQ